MGQQENLADFYHANPQLNPFAYAIKIIRGGEHWRAIMYLEVFARMLGIRPKHEGNFVLSAIEAVKSQESDTTPPPPPHNHNS